MYCIITTVPVAFYGARSDHIWLKYCPKLSSSCPEPQFLPVWPRFEPFWPPVARMRRNRHKTTSTVKSDPTLSSASPISCSLWLNILKIGPRFHVFYPILCCACACHNFTSGQIFNPIAVISEGFCNNCNFVKTGKPDQIKTT